MRHIDLSARPRFASLAITAAIVFAACVFGFVASKAFAVFLLYLVGAVALAGIGFLFLTVGDELGWFGAIVIGMIFLGSLATLIGGISEALAVLKST